METLLSAVSPSKRTVKPSVRRIVHRRGCRRVAILPGPVMSRTLQAGGKIVASLGTTSTMRWLAVTNLEDELTDEGLVSSLRSVLSPCGKSSLS